MGSVLKGPPKPDLSQQKAMMLEQKNRLAEQKAEIDAEKAAKRRRGQGRASLISGRETGVPSGSTPKRTSLG